MGSKLPTTVAVHLHGDLDVSPTRVKAFGRAAYETQLNVLALLRARSGDDTTSAEVSLAALLLAFAALFIAPSRGLNFDGLPWLAAAIASGIFTLILATVLLPFIVSQVLRRGRTERAAVWLSAYEDEINRRRAMDGKGGRDWRNAH
ncbi:hypothetical protein [Cryobacterium sp. W22_MBD10_FK3]|uniref:hypothetical protein n=1 Tax=Cryobacterium sp. W22_MBD10_FK3 TaxID=3240273 RepID=UPI003F91A70C